MELLNEWNVNKCILEATGSTISVKTGNDIVLPCDIKRANLGRFPFVIEWSRPENPLPIFYKIGRYPSRVNSNFKGEIFNTLMLVMKLFKFG